MRTTVVFDAEDGTTLRGFVFRDDSGSPGPIIVMAHGFSGVTASLIPYAQHFADNGFVVLLFDNRNFGSSDGEPRQHINPYQQIADFRDAITFAQTLPDADPTRIGIWGSSYAGGHVLAVGACDRRVRCVVSQIPMISGHRNAPRLFMPARLKSLRRQFAQERSALLAGAKPTYVPVFSSDPHADDCVFPPESAEFIARSEEAEGWRNEVTLRSVEYLIEYEPGSFAPFVSPTPLLMIVGANDTVNPPDLQLEAFERALEPKRLHIHPGGHFGTYTRQFESTSTEASNWFLQHLT
jgi:dienelactone hydrolase